MYLIFIIILYLFVNNPIFVGIEIGSVKLLYIIALLFFLFNRKSILVFKRYRIESFIYLLLLLYVLLLFLFGSDSGMLRTIIVAFSECLILPVFIVEFYYKYLSKSDFYKPILIVGSIGAVISSLCFFIPEINLFFRSIQQMTEKMFYIENRGYGLSEGLTYSYSLVQACIFYIGLTNLKTNKWFIFFIPFLFLSVAFNARIGIIILFVSLLIYLLQNRSFKQLIYSLLIFVIVFLFLNQIDFESVNNFAFIWVREFFYEMSDTIFNTQLAQFSTLDTLFYDMYVVPDNISEWIVGRGNTMFGVMGGTDVGYLQLLNYGGLFLIFLFAILIYYMSMRMLKYKFYFFLLFFLSVFLISEIKGNFIPNSGAFRLLCLLYVFIIETKNRTIFNQT